MLPRIKPVAREVVVALLMYAAVLGCVVAVTAQGEQERDLSARTVPEVVNGLLHHRDDWLGRTVLVAGTPGGAASLSCGYVLLAWSSNMCDEEWSFLVDAARPLPSGAAADGPVAYFADSDSLPVAGGCSRPEPAARAEDLRAVYRVRLGAAEGGIGAVACSWERPYRPAGAFKLARRRVFGWFGLPDRLR